MPGRDLLRLQLMFQIAAVRRYAELPIPSDEDVLAEEFVTEWVAGASGSAEAPKALEGISRGVPSTFAIRAASRAVRDHNVEFLRLGLAAFCISGDRSDSRDLQQGMAILYDACTKLHVSSDDLFREVAGLAKGGAARSLAEFAGLVRNSFNLRTYRVREGSDWAGFRYRLGLAGAA